MESPRAKRLFALLTFICMCTVAAHQADVLPRHARGGSLFQSLLKEKHANQIDMGQRLGLASWAPNSVANYKDAVLDHATGEGAYRQRFFFDTTFCGTKCKDPSTPIICEFTGEWTASSAPDGAAAELAHKLGALTCTLEHRFGCSPVRATIVYPCHGIRHATRGLQRTGSTAARVPKAAAFLRGTRRTWSVS
jgi:hypothetical protein